MIKLKFNFLLFILLFQSCFTPRIYNDGLYYKIPNRLKVENFFYDIENISMYEGKHKQYYRKISSFSWEDPNSDRRIEAALFFVRINHNDYAFEYRRYDYYPYPIEVSYSKKPILNFLHLKEDNDIELRLRPHFPVIWSCENGYFEKYEWDLKFDSAKSFAFLDSIENNSNQLLIEFPFVSPHNADGRDLSEEDFYELPNRMIHIEKEEFQEFRNTFLELFKSPNMTDKEYLEHASTNLLK